jgi:tetraacyldisaccharide 4'-kinase
MPPVTLTPPPPSRSPWQRFYGWVLERRRAWYSTRARRLPCPVVSVGNLHWGGTGKTPLTAAIAAHLRDASRTVAILSRGYKGKGDGVRVVSTGDGPLLGPGLAGDEPVLLAGELPGVGVVVGPDRYLAGVHALERFDPQPDLFLLDDGFSHVRLARDLDILVFPAADPFASGRLAPSGRLREPLTASRHAAAVVMTAARPGDGAALGAALAPFGFAGSAFDSRTVALPAHLSSGGPLNPGARVITVSGIARSRPFLELAREQGFEIVASLDLPDHHGYPDATLRSIQRLWLGNSADAVLTTSKDQVKLLGRLDLPLAELPIRAEPEESFWGWLEHRVAALSEHR